MSNFSKTFRHNNSLRCKLVLDTSLQLTVMNSDDMSTKQLNLSLPKCLQKVRLSRKERDKMSVETGSDQKSQSMQIITTSFCSEDSIEVSLIDYTKKKVLKVYWVFMKNLEPVISINDLGEEVK